MEELIINQIGKESQCNMILKHCRTGKPITSLEATLRYGITSLHRRLSDLRNKGYVFSKVKSKGNNGKRYIKYYIKS